MKVSKIEKLFVDSGVWKGIMSLRINCDNKILKGIGLPRMVEILLDEIPYCKRIVCDGDFLKQPKSELFTLFENFKSWFIVRGLQEVLIRADGDTQIPSEIFPTVIRGFTHFEIDWFNGFPKPIANNYSFILGKRDTVLFRVHDEGDMGLVLDGVEKILVHKLSPRILVTVPTKELYEIGLSMLNWKEISQQLDLQLTYN